MLWIFDFHHPRTRQLAMIGAALCAALILFLSLAPSDSLPRFQWSDKVQHFIAYVALSGPLLIAMGRRRLWSVIALAAVFGVALEIAQGAMGLGRTFSLLDAVANTLGAVTGAGLAAFLLSLRGTKEA